VVAAVALKAGASLTSDEIRAGLKARIASYLVPRHIAVYADQADLPWLDSGKIDRRALTGWLIEQFAGRD
jgi:acyl-coenzyme A synthetase/AMP-(fatty) acid ligase